MLGDTGVVFPKSEFPAGLEFEKSPTLGFGDSYTTLAGDSIFYILRGDGSSRFCF
jgi:hypothetical protein